MTNRILHGQIWIWALIIAVALLAFFLLRRGLNMTINETILTLTLLAIIWYSLETRGMK